MYSSIIIVLPQHIPYLLECLEPIWPEWELLGVALGVTHNMLQTIKSSHQPPSQDKLLRSVIEAFGETTTLHTWRKIHDTVIMLNRYDIADEIKKNHSNLDEPCMPMCSNCIVLNL